MGNTHDIIGVDKIIVPGILETAAPALFFFDVFQFNDQFKERNRAFSQVLPVEPPLYLVFQQLDRAKPPMVICLRIECEGIVFSVRFVIFIKAFYQQDLTGVRDVLTSCVTGLRHKRAYVRRPAG